MAKGIYTFRIIQRFYAFFNAYLGGILAFTKIPMKAGMIKVFPAVFGLTTFFHLGVIGILHKRASTTTLSIDWDVTTNQFIVKRARALYGVAIKRVNLHDFQMLDDKQDDSCLYYDKKTGEKFYTVNMGMWYNQGVLYHLFEM